MRWTAAGNVAALALAVPGAATADTTVEAETMRLRPDKLRADAAASGGRVAALLRRGHATKTLTTGAVQRIVIFARGDSCPSRAAGAPPMTVTVDGRRRFAVRVASRGLAAYVVERPLAPGRHRLRIAYRRDHRARRCDRNLWLDRIVLVGPAAPAPPPAPAAPSGPALRTVTIADFETGSFSQWNAVQSEAGGNSRVVSSPVRQGAYAAAFTLPGGGKRAEVFKSDAAYVSEGDERVYRWSTMPAAGYQPAPLSSYELIIQWKDDGGGSPPMAFEIEGPNYALKTDGGLKSAGPLNPGQWTDFEVRAKFSSSASSGWVEVLRNGQVVIPRFATANLTRGKRSYLKQGLYRGSSGTVSTVYHDAMTVLAP